MSGPPFVDCPRGPRQNKCLFSFNPWPLSKFIDRKLRQSQVPTTTERGQSRTVSLTLSLQCPLPTTPCGQCRLHTSPGLSLVLGDSIGNILQMAEKWDGQDFRGVRAWRSSPLCGFYRGGRSISSGQGQPQDDLSRPLGVVGGAAITTLERLREGVGSKGRSPTELNCSMKGLFSKGRGPGGGAQDCSGLAAASLLGLPLGRGASSLCPLCSPSHPKGNAPCTHSALARLQQVLTWPFWDC